MRKHLGITSLLILMFTYLILRFYVTPYFWLVIVIGYLTSLVACLYSESGVWRKISATILILIPTVVIVIFLAFAFEF